jgi:kynureninase
MDYLERTQNGHSFVGSDINIFRAIALASALDLYAKTGMQASRLHKPTVMLRTAETMTGLKFKRGQYTQAADALRLLAEGQKRAPRLDQVEG